MASKTKQYSFSFYKDRAIVARLSIKKEMCYMIKELLLVMAFMGSTFTLQASSSELAREDREIKAMWDKAEKKMSKERKSYLKEEARKAAIAQHKSKGPYPVVEIETEEYRLFGKYFVKWQKKIRDNPSLLTERRI